MRHKGRLFPCVSEQKRLAALGNVIVCNDYVALVHPEIDRETEEIIAGEQNPPFVQFVSQKRFQTCWEWKCFGRRLRATRWWARTRR